MRKETFVMTVGVAALAVWQLSGCNLGRLVRVEVPPFELNEALGAFEVQAGQAVQNTGDGSFDLSGFSIGSGSIGLDASAITVTPANSSGGKGSVNLQDSSVLRITVWIASAGELATVCTTGEQYGPFEVTLDGNYVPVSVDPSEVELTDNTIALVNSGAFSLCIEVVSPVDGTVRIENLSFELGL